MPIQTNHSMNNPAISLPMAACMACPKTLLDLASPSFQALVLPEDCTAETYVFSSSAWQKLSVGELYKALSQGMKPTSVHIQALLGSMNATLNTLLTTMLEAWPEATPIDVGTQLDEFYLWEELSPNKLLLLLDLGMVPTPQQIQALFDSSAPEKLPYCRKSSKPCPKTYTIATARHGIILGTGCHSPKEIF
jgi:hypothetical protein